MTADHRELIARTPEEFREKNGITVLTGHRVTSIDAGGATVEVEDLSSGRRFTDGYTRLLISTGAFAFVPPIEGAGLEGCFTLRRLEDGLSIKRFIKERGPARAVVIGAGPIGVEMCEAFRILGLDVTVVELADRVLPFMDPDMAAKVQGELEREGVRCMLGTRLESFEGGTDGRVRRVATSGGELDCDIAVLGIGIKPSSELAERAGAAIGARGAIKVDSTLATTLPAVYAAGDCATTTDRVTGAETWVPLGSTSRKQGRAAAANMFGARQEYPGVVGTALVKCFDLTVGRTGLDEEEARQAGFEPESISIEAESLHDYFPGGGKMDIKLVADRAGGRLLGAQVLGELAAVPERRLDVFAVAITERLSAEELQYLDLAYAPPYSTAIDPAIIAGNIICSKIHGKECACGPHGLE